EQAVIGRAERDRNDRGKFHVVTVGDRPRIARRHSAQLCMRSLAKNGCDLLPDLQVGHLSADLDNLTAGLIANDMRLAGERPAPSIERIAALDAYRLDPNNHAFGMANRIGYLFILQNIWRSVLVINCRFHRRFSFLSKRLACVRRRDSSRVSIDRAIAWRMHSDRASSVTARESISAPAIEANTVRASSRLIELSSSATSSIRNSSVFLNSCVNASRTLFGCREISAPSAATRQPLPGLSR